MTAQAAAAFAHAVAMSITPGPKPAPGHYRIDVGMEGRVAGEVCMSTIAGTLHVGPRGGLRFEPDTIPNHYPKKKRA